MDDDPQRQLDRLFDQLSEMRRVRTRGGKMELQEFSRLYKASKSLTTVLAAAGAAFGECRKDDPYKPIKPVIDANGDLMWCCEHDPPHCAK